MLRSLALLLALALWPTALMAQGLADALRLATDPLPSGARSLAMGGGLISAAEGYSALEANPAAIAPLGTREFGLTLFDNNHSSSSQYFDQTSTASINAFSLGSLGLAAPFATVQGHLAVGVSYDRQREFNTTYRFDAVNPTSTLFNTRGFIQDPFTSGSYGNQSWLTDHNLAYALHLTNPVADTGAVTLTTPFTSGFRESGTVTESGSLDALRIGAGVDIAEGVSVGAAVNILIGSYDWNRDYTATHAGASPDTTTLTTATISDNVHEDQSGASIKFGLLVSKLKAFRFGLTVETPQIIHVTEQDVQSGTSQFSDGRFYTSDNSNALPVYQLEYDIWLPTRLGAGASLHLAGLTASASATYADMSAIRFKNPTPVYTSFADKNQEAVNLLRPVVAWQIGAEYIIPIVGLSVRAGFADEPSPYQGDPSTFDTKKISAGLGILLGKSVLLEGSWRHSTYHTSHTIYNDSTPSGQPISAFIPDDAVSRDDIALTLNYRW
ncbi:MAG: hypothetical protein Q8922_04595 [Bacteroidota bacterium]|nr:hypothetical protein [Bacteroidota bacterium]MDP4231860.1 hypothetical protein [Bacteroidota bacterium]MDP4242746.1 hypothetical protein [Bacteroidota bacterium]MDP4287197.1 hypothetical protein [Bacteroidota bacterium]